MSRQCSWRRWSPLLYLRNTSTSTTCGTCREFKTPGSVAMCTRTLCFWRNLKVTCSLLSTLWRAGAYSGDSRSGIGPEKSAAVVIGPNRQWPACSVMLSGSVLPVVQSYRYLGVLRTHCLRWDAHAEHLVACSRPFAQCASWARALPPCHTSFSAPLLAWSSFLGQLQSQYGAV